VIQLVWVAGVGLVLVGVLIQAGGIAQLRELPRDLGYVLIVLGFAKVFILPTLLARRWRSPRE
jgi:hypothetical protein